MMEARLASDSGGDQRIRGRAAISIRKRETGRHPWTRPARAVANLREVQRLIPVQAQSGESRCVERRAAGWRTQYARDLRSDAGQSRTMRGWFKQTDADVGSVLRRRVRQCYLALDGRAEIRSRDLSSATYTADEMHRMGQ